MTCECAVRRTRSIVKLLGDILPGELARAMAPSSGGWVRSRRPRGTSTCVLLSVDELAASVTRPADLDPIRGAHPQPAGRSHINLVRALRSRRLRQPHVGSGRAELESVSRWHRPYQLTASQLADERVAQRIFRKVRKRARPHRRRAAPAEEVHATSEDLQGVAVPRRDCSSRCAHRRPTSRSSVTSRICKTYLANFRITRCRLRPCVCSHRNLIDGGAVKAGTILAMGELCGRFDASQRVARDELTAHHDAYLGKQARTARQTSGTALNTIASYNVKGGVGKTTAAVNLAYCRRGTIGGRCCGTSTRKAPRPTCSGSAPASRAESKLVQQSRPLLDAVKATDFEGLDLLPADFTYRHMDIDLNERPKPERTLRRLLQPLEESTTLSFSTRRRACLSSRRMC